MPKVMTINKVVGKPDQEMIQRINSKLMECAGKLNYSHEMPKVVFDLKGRTAGYAVYSENKIRLNNELLFSNTEEMIENTLPHEFAHIASYKFYGREGTGHGFYWKRTMLQLDLEPERCHQMDVKPAKVHQKFDYICGCPGTIHKIGKNVHEKIQAGISPRYCKRCRVWIKEV